MKSSRSIDIPRVLTIAGSDSGGGAGIQADLKTFAANGVYGTSAVTAVTAQNTTDVTDVLELPTKLIESQIDAVLGDIGADTVKTGMLSSGDIVRCVASKMREYSIEVLVVDPVMFAKGGHSLLDEEAVQIIREVLLPIATVVTPNILEASALTGLEIRDIDTAREAAVELVKLGADAAVVKGGHMEDGPATDILYDGSEFRLFTTKRVNTPNTHGTGCTFASAISAQLAKGNTVREAVSSAKTYVTGAIINSLNIGSGHGPLNHFYQSRYGL